MFPCLGIIAGKGKLPLEIADIYTTHSHGKCYIAAVDEEAESDSTHVTRYFNIGAVGKIVKFFKEHRVTDIVLIGHIARPDLLAVKPDLMGSRLIARIMKNNFSGDNNILKITAGFIEEQGFNIISPQTILAFNDYSPYSTSRTATDKDRIDIKLGQDILNLLGSADIGQSIISCNGYILGIEAAEGTDNLINRCALLRTQPAGGVLVKTAKSAQDMRLDIPVIGPDTVLNLARGNFNGLAIDRYKVIISNSKKTYELLNQYNLFLHFL